MKPHIANFIADYLGEMIEGNAAVFAGAGLSVPAGYVDWRALLRPLSEELGLSIDLEDDLVAVAQFHVNWSGQNRHAIHKQIIEALSPDNASRRARAEHDVNCPTKLQDAPFAERWAKVIKVAGIKVN
jgi:hypothetical protein